MGADAPTAMQEHKVDNYGWKYKRKPSSADYLYLPIIREIEKRNPKRVLDIGCGNGSLAIELAARGISVTGIDADENGIRLAKEQAGDLKSLRFESLGVGADVPSDFSKPGFDLILSTEVVEHLYLPGQLFAFASGCLTKDGILLVSTPYHGYLKNLAICLRNQWDKHHQPRRNGGHIKFWSRATLGALAAEYGFAEIGFSGAGRFPLFWKSMIMEFRLSP